MTVEASSHRPPSGFSDFGKSAVIAQVVRLLASGVLLAAVVFVLSAAPKASAAYPGRDGLIAYNQEDNRYRPAPRIGGVEPRTGRARVLFRLGFGRSPRRAELYRFAFSPDGRQLTFDLVGRRGGIYLTSARTPGRVRRLTRHFDPSGKFGDDHQPDWSPDGRSIVFSRWYRRPELGDAFEIGSIARRGREVGELHPKPAGPKDLIRMPRLARVRRMCFLQCLRVYHRGRSRAIAREGFHPTWSVRNLIAFEGPDERIWVVRPDGSGLRRVVRGVAPDWSPDGRRLVFQRPHYGLGPSRDRQIATIGSNGRGFRVLARGHRPVYSPSGKWIAYSEPYVDPRLCVITPNGRRKRCFRRPASPPSGFTPIHLDWQPLPRG